MGGKLQHILLGHFHLTNSTETKETGAELLCAATKNNLRIVLHKFSDSCLPLWLWKQINSNKCYLAPSLNMFLCVAFLHPPQHAMFDLYDALQYLLIKVQFQNKRRRSGWQDKGLAGVFFLQTKVTSVYSNETFRKRHCYSDYRFRSEWLSR